MKQYSFENLSEADLVIDAVYNGGNLKHVGDDPITKIIPCGNMGGFRYSGSLENLKYIILYSSGENIDWPDSIDYETGIFKYYGDNRTPGHEIHDTKKKGNLILKNIFDSLSKNRLNIPPIFIFEKSPNKESNRSVQFKGLCVPGTSNKLLSEDLVAIWKTSSGQRFQNYRAFFTILDIPVIKRAWIEDLKEGNVETLNTPKEYINWLRNGKYTPLLSPKVADIRLPKEQVPEKNFEKSLLDIIHKYFEENPTMFEYLAADIYKMTNKNIIIDEVTRGTVDGGRDAIGRLKLGLNNDPIYVEFALEAKCYNPGITGTQNTVGVKEVARLISRIRNRQFGVLVTTSVIGKQAYEEVRKDKHPIIFICGKDIVNILIENGINTENTLKKFLLENYSI